MSRGREYTGDVLKIGELYDVEELRSLGGAIDYVVGTPLTKVYCLAEHPDPKQQHYLNLYKMGAGPLYSFFIPYHLVHFEVPNAIARAVLFRDPVIKPLGGPVVEVCAVAKRDLKAGEALDVALPAGRLADRLRGDQYLKFRGETWLNDLLAASRLIDQARCHAVDTSASSRGVWPATLPSEPRSDRVLG
jgi:hypothetical protein